MNTSPVKTPFLLLTKFNCNSLGVDWDHKTRTKAIYRITAPGHKGWSRNVDSELGNYDFLLGIDVSYILTLVP